MYVTVLRYGRVWWVWCTYGEEEGGHLGLPPPLLREQLTDVRVDRRVNARDGDLRPGP
eukprot:COSAG05_NODE_347_length_10963_cov_157.340943_14_plen_58_part_00